MSWVILALVGVALALCAAGLCIIVTRNRALRCCSGSVQIRRRRAGKSRWSRGYGMWVNDTFVFRGSSSVRSMSTIAVRDIVTLFPAWEDRERLRRLGPNPAIVRLLGDDGYVDLATVSDFDLDLFGPFVVAAVSRKPVSTAERQPFLGIPRCDTLE